MKRTCRIALFFCSAPLGGVPFPNCRRHICRLIRRMSRHGMANKTTETCISVKHLYEIGDMKTCTHTETKTLKMVDFVYDLNDVKGTTGPRMSSERTKLNGSYHKFKRTQILLKFPLQNIDPTSTLKSQPNIKSLAL